MKTKKVQCTVTFSKGVTVSKNYQSTRSEISISMPFELGTNGSGFSAAEASKNESISPWDYGSMTIHRLSTLGYIAPAVRCGRATGSLNRGAPRFSRAKADEQLGE